MGFATSIAGTTFTWLAFGVMLATLVLSLLSLIRRDDQQNPRVKLLVWASAGCMVIAVLILVFAFIGNAFEIGYVARHSSVTQPALLKLSALWAGQQGSLLFWSMLQCIVTTLAVSLRDQRARPMISWVTLILTLISLFFTGLTLFLNNPFILESHYNSHGLNPLLRHPGMAFHPPAMYVGYVTLSVPFAFAIAALLSDRLDDWSKLMRPWILTAWLGLSLGLLLGMRWAYDVLGWGGYWGWDPVENAGLMPWLTTTGLLHSVIMQRERRGFVVWNYALATLSFSLVLFGTFITRSGMIQSVHAYAQGPIGGVLIGAVLVAVVGGGSFGIRYRDRFRLDDNADPPLLSRYGAFSLTIIMLCMLTLSIFVGTTLPSITSAFGSHQYEATPIWYDRVTGPQFAVLVGLLGLCPVIGRSVKGLFRMSVRHYGGYLIHLGIVLIAIGVIGTRLYSHTHNLSLKVGETKPVGDLTIRLDSSGDCSDTSSLCESADLVLEQGGNLMARLSPQIVRYPGYADRHSIPAVRSTLMKDIYIVLGGVDSEADVASVHVLINPLVSFIWSGGIVLLVGGVWALYPWQENRIKQAGYVATIALILSLTVWVMWGVPVRFSG